MTRRTDMAMSSDNEIMTRSVLPTIDAACPGEDVGVVSTWSMRRAPRDVVILTTTALHERAAAGGWDSIHLGSGEAGLDGWTMASEQWPHEFVSAFANGQLVFSLRNRGVRAIYLAGGPLEHAVDVSARDGADLGFDVWIVAEAVEAEARGSEHTHLERLATYSGVYVCSIDDIPFTTTTGEAGGG